jgi:signal transduction histidine kinase
MASLDESRLLLELTRKVSSTLDLQAVLDQSLAALRQLLDFDGGSIQLVDDGRLRLMAADPAAPAEAYEFRLPLGQGFGGRVVVSGEPVYSPDATVDLRAHPVGRAKASTPGVRSWFGAPLIFHGRVIGVVQIDSHLVDAFSPEAQALVLSFVPTMSAAVQNALLYRQERDALSRTNEFEKLKHDFVSLVSHELRTPLTAVTGFAATLSRHAHQLRPEAVAEMGSRIEAASRRLGLLVSDLLDISGIQRGALDVVVTTVSVDATIAQLVEERVAPQHNLVVDIEPNLPPVHADPERLSQVLWKLVDNARKFSPDGSLIRVRAVRGDAHVMIAVDDEGRGIPPEHLARVFEPFFQVEEALTRSAGGLGTGLYLARQICEAMGAHLDVESEPGRGSTFTVRLPVAAPGALAAHH